MNHHLRRALALASAAASSAALLAHRPVAGPGHDLGTLAGWRGLLDRQGPVVAAFAALRVAMLVVAVLLVALGLLHALAAGHGGLRLTRVARSLTPRVLRPFLGVVTIATLSAPAMASAVPSRPPGAADTTTSPPPVMVLVDSPTTTTPPAAAPPTMRRVDPTAATPSGTAAAITTAPRELVVSPIAAKARPAIEATAPAPSTSPTSPTSPSPSTPSSPSTSSSPSTPATWTIRRGEHLWSVAEQVTSGALARDATDAEVEPYWRTLIAANRDRLIDRDNPDLVHAGQELVLPPYATPVR